MSTYAEAMERRRKAREAAQANPPTDTDADEQFDDSWKTSKPRQITLNFSIEAFLARKLQSLGLDFFVKDEEATMSANTMTVTTGKHAGVNMRQRGHTDATGAWIADNGIKIDLKPANGSPICLRKLEDSLKAKLGFVLTGLWLVMKNNGGKVRYQLKVRFDGYRVREQGFTNTMLWHYNDGIRYYEEFPEPNFNAKQCAAFDTRELVQATVTFWVGI